MEEYRDIKGYEGIYQVSNLGNVKSLARKTKNQFCKKDIILKKTINFYGYINAGLCVNGNLKTKRVHILVAEAFLNHKTNRIMVVNHINFDRTDNRLENLEIVTNRENTNKKHLKSTSKYTGVSWDKRSKKWMARILVNRKSVFLGRFINEYAAHLAYINKLKNEQ